MDKIHLLLELEKIQKALDSLKKELTVQKKYIIHREYQKPITVYGWNDMKTVDDYLSAVTNVYHTYGSFEVPCWSKNTTEINSLVLFDTEQEALTYINMKRNTLEDRKHFCRFYVEELEIEGE